MAASSALICLPFLTAFHQASSRPADLSHDYPIKPVPFTEVQVDDQFWAPRIETNRKVSIPTAFDHCERTGRVENFVRAAEAIRGRSLADKHAPGYPFDDTDIYKVIEGASYTLSVHPDPKLSAYVDQLIAKIAAAQEPDGYIYTTREIDPEHPHDWAGTERWENEEILSHELYNLGHLYEAAVAHYQATGQRNLLDIATRSADLLVKTFGPDKRAIYPGHQIVEMGLAKLYRVTGNDQYLALAKFMLDSRGPGGQKYNQADLRVIDQTEAEGHAVRAGYMYSGMADVAALTGDSAYLKAIDQIWNNVVGKKLYLTGGIGSTGAGEAFGANYELPNMTAYNETCAAVANDYWNQRLFLLHGDAKYIDVFERTLYNGLLSGVSLDGKTYFYPNPLESNGQHQRSAWFGVACCPGNITRFMPSIPGYVYAHQADSIYVNLYMTNKARIQLAGGKAVQVAQQTRYPWDGSVHISVDPEQAAEFTMKIRVPGWARGEVVPSDLYRFEDQSALSPVLKVNGSPVEIQLAKGYAVVKRTWKKGDSIDLELPMPIRRVLANEKVEDDRHRVALERGPLVYAAEWVDSPDKHVRNILLPASQKLSTTFKPELLNGVQVIEGEADYYRFDAKHQMQASRAAFTAIPYYAWANRGRGQMEVWIADEKSALHPTHFPTLAMNASVTASGEQVTSNGIKDPKRAADDEDPSSSKDNSSYYDWYPRKGTSEWLQYDFPKKETVSSAEVYWFAEGHHGDIAAPSSWRILYKDGDQWKPVHSSSSFGTALDSFNKVKFNPVQTTSLRLEVTLQPNRSAGVSEWRVQ
jgi:uncharacterized protein